MGFLWIWLAHVTFKVWRMQIVCISVGNYATSSRFSLQRMLLSILHWHLPAFYMSYRNFTGAGLFFNFWLEFPQFMDPPKQVGGRNRPPIRIKLNMRA